MNVQSSPLRPVADPDRIPYEDEDEFEPMYGLPEIPPEDEKILWQGEPAAWPVAQRVFHLSWVTVYFALLSLWSVADVMGGGATLSEALSRSSVLLYPFAAVMMLLWGWAYSVAKTTVYTITSKRIVIRAGVALSKAINIPFAQVIGVSVRRTRGGTTDIAVQLEQDARPAYLMLWPHARPWHWSRVEPMLRGIENSDAVEELLGTALRSYHDQGGAEDMHQVADSEPLAAPTLVAVQ